MKKVIIYLPKGQIEYKTEDDYGKIADYVYTNYPNNLGFKVESTEMKLKLNKEGYFNA